MELYIKNTLIGFIIGFVIYLIELESPDLGNIIFRTDSSGKKVFSPESILNMMKAPFKINRFWTDYKLIRTNWVVLCGLGALGGIGYTFIFF